MTVGIVYLQVGSILTRVFWAYLVLHVANWIVAISTHARMAS